MNTRVHLDWNRTALRVQFLRAVILADWRGWCRCRWPLVLPVPVYWYCNKKKYYDMTNKFLFYFLLDISGYCKQIDICIYIICGLCTLRKKDIESIERLIKGKRVTAGFLRKIRDRQIDYIDRQNRQTDKVNKRARRKVTGDS